jgi:hypothetical protein
MTDVHYFQRFSKKEDVVTNNTLLLLSRLQHHDLRIFETVLKSVSELEDLRVGANITQQESSPSKRIADGVLRQPSFHIVVETKLADSFNLDQLAGHLSAFDTSSADVEALLLLAPTVTFDLPAAKARVGEYNQRNGRNVRLASITFADLVGNVTDAIPDHERALTELIRDYEAFCGEHGLLPEGEAELLVVGCSRSLPENVDLRLYYDNKKPSRSAQYIGFYSDKAVRALGTLSTVARVDRIDGKLRIVEGPALSDDELERVARAMDSAVAHGWKIDQGCYFFLASELLPTQFRKHSKGPLWGRRYLNLRDTLSVPKPAPLPPLTQLAADLKDRAW